MKHALTVAALLLALAVLVPCSSHAAGAPAAKARFTAESAPSLPPGPDGERFMAWLHQHQPQLKSGCGDCWSIGWECCRGPWFPFGYFCVDPSAGEACAG